MSDADIYHNGVKGMKWGVRKERHAVEKRYKLGPNQIKVKAKNGTEISLDKNAAPAIQRLLAKHGNKAAINFITNQTDYTISANGKKIGSASIEARKNHELYLNWINVKTAERGNGYATAILTGCKAVSKELGYKKLTLEVPGNSPDAEHIYSKLGFKDAGMLDDPGKVDVWGGLKKMELRL